MARNQRQRDLVAKCNYYYFLLIIFVFMKIELLLLYLYFLFVYLRGLHPTNISISTYLIKISFYARLFNGFKRG